MKHLEETPWWICDAEDENYCAYVDTDSNYFNAEPLLLHLYPNFEEFTDKEKDNILEKVALKYQDVINEDYDRLAREAFNVTEHRLEMKTECVIRSAYFRATRRYAQWITKQEGIENEQLDIKGLEFMKANFPPILGSFFNDILQQVLKGEQKDSVLDQIKVFKKSILDGSIPLTKLGNPSAVKKLEKYSGKNARAGEMFTELLKGAPAPVRAAVRYNDLLRLWQLDKKHNLITQADKVKWIYLKDNPYKIEGLAFYDYDMPDKIKDFLDAYADRQKVFDSILLNKLEGFFSDLQWSLDLNPYTNALASFEI
jgi:DNA polymerase elongation subunit (family B)|tara:strand:- start:877 stop:1812 length:936 start_codon:yes stop_codon:yes gene_type:complete